MVAATPDPAVIRRHAVAAALFLDHRRAAASVVPGALGELAQRRAGPAPRPILADGRPVSVAVARPAGRLSVAVEGPDDLAEQWGGPPPARRCGRG